MLLEVEIRRSGSDSAARIIDERRERAIAVGPDDDADVRCALEEHRAQALRHASGNAHHRRRLHVPLELPEPPDHALLGVIANRAGVDENHVGAVGTVDGIVARCRELPEHQLGVAHVHLAAVSLDVNCGTTHAVTVN